MSHQIAQHQNDNVPDPTVEQMVEAVKDKFLLADPPDYVGGNLDDTHDVQACLEEAVSYFHQQLPSEIQKTLENKWGINKSMIEAKQIGYVDGSNDVVDHLLDEGFAPLTITRASIATNPTIKHLFTCDGVNESNADLIPEERQDAEVSDSCNHYHIDPQIELLVRAQVEDIIDPAAIDIEAVVEYLTTHGEMDLYVPWDSRIIFPYRNQDGQIVYLIGRATENTDDIVYSNGIDDRSTSSFTTVADTPLGDDLCRQTDVTTTQLEEYEVIPLKETPYKSPYRDDTQDAVNKISQLLPKHAQGKIDLSTDSLQQLGILPVPERLSENSVPVHILDVSDDPSIESDYAMSTPATGIQPGTELTLINHTDMTAHFEPEYTPADATWDDSTISESATIMCDQKGTYRFTIAIEDTTLRGLVAAYSTINTTTRYDHVESWLEGEPGFDVDVAKYVKQTIDRDWINHDAVEEPIFGVETIHDDKPLVITEGVTDAIVAHQHNIPCIAPATTSFKAEHYDKICDLVENVSTIFVVNDNETHNEGVKGAIKTAQILQDRGYPALVAELPRPAGTDKIDLAEYLRTHSRADFINLLTDAIHPDDHELSDEVTNPTTTATPSKQSQPAQTYSGKQNTGQSSFEADSEHSKLYDLTMEDVLPLEELGVSRGTGIIYRGPNPIGDVGNSDDYFVIRDHGDRLTAKDFKISGFDGYLYNPRTWLACAASCDCEERCDCTRHHRSPTGSLSRSEVWWAWKYAKEHPEIPMPDDDPIPVKALWFLADYHDLMPTEHIPDDFNDDRTLPDTTYNQVLEIVESTYGLNPGR